MRAAPDFNYKVALASGLQSLKAGRLRPAEEQFRYLVERFPGSSGGYRGLAKVLVELEDRAAAFAILRDGGAALAKAGDRAGAITLFREAVGIEPRDTTAHRRFAAALALSGDLDGAAAEVARYVEALSGPAGDAARARLEVAYAVERLGQHPRLAALAARFGVSGEIVDAPGVAEDAPQAESVTQDARESEPATDDAPGLEAVPDDDLESEALEERAAQLIARGDPHAPQTALAAARRHLADGRAHAASDLLLQLISSGAGGYEAQRALVDVLRAAGRPDLARAKCVLLAQALRLEGREELAGELEQLASTV